MPGCSGGAKAKLTGTNCGCGRCAFMARRLRNCLMSVASTPPIIASSPKVISQSPVLCDCACVSGAAFSDGLAGCGAAGAAGSKSNEMELIKAAASTGVACRRPGRSCGCSASVVSTGEDITSADGWGSDLGSLLGSLVATGASSARAAAEGCACAFDFARNERQSAPNQHVLPATACSAPIPARSFRLGRLSNRTPGRLRQSRLPTPGPKTSALTNVANSYGCSSTSHPPQNIDPLGK